MSRHVDHFLVPPGNCLCCLFTCSLFVFVRCQTGEDVLFVCLCFIYLHVQCVELSGQTLSHFIEVFWDLNIFPLKSQVQP